MKMNIKVLVIGIIVGLLLSGIIVYAENVISGSQVSYQDHAGLGADNVQTAIEKVNEKATTKVNEAEMKCPTGYICNYAKGVEVETKNSNIVAAYTYHQTKCPTGAESTCQETNCIKYKNTGICGPGTIIKYKVNDSEVKYFNVLHDDGEKMTIQQNTATTMAAWNVDDTYWQEGPKTALAALDEATSTWTNVEAQTYTMGTTSFGNLGKYTSCPSWNSCTVNSYAFETRTSKARMIMVQEAVALGCQSHDNPGQCPPWLSNGTWQYHTLNSVADAGNWRIVEGSGYLGYTYGHTYSSIRAVIVVSK